MRALTSLPHDRSDPPPSPTLPQTGTPRTASLSFLRGLVRPVLVVAHDVREQRLAAREDPAEGLIQGDHCGEAQGEEWGRAW